MWRVTAVMMTAMLLGAADMQKAQFTGVVTTVYDALGEAVPVTVRREIGRECFTLELDPETVFGGTLAAESVPGSCKVTHVATLGQLYPMRLAPGVETVGELEVLAFIGAAAKEAGSRLLVDSRGSRWYEHITIPSAVNIPFIYIKEPERFPDETARVFKRFGVTGSPGAYDFSNAKTLMIFCNGPWCSSSPEMIKGLLKAGYPAQKIFWYRGGLHDWSGLGMTLQRGESTAEF